MSREARLAGGTNELGSEKMIIVGFVIGDSAPVLSESILMGLLFIMGALDGGTRRAMQGEGGDDEM